MGSRDFFVVSADERIVLSLPRWLVPCGTAGHPESGETQLEKDGATVHGDSHGTGSTGVEANGRRQARRWRRKPSGDARVARARECDRTLPGVMRVTVMAGLLGRADVRNMFSRTELLPPAQCGASIALSTFGVRLSAARYSAHVCLVNAVESLEGVGGAGGCGGERVRRVEEMME